MLRLYLGKLAPLLSDKAAEVRKAAGDALRAVYTNVDPAGLLTFVAHASGPDLVSGCCGSAAWPALAPADAGPPAHLYPTADAPC
jgi:hypothetical protein